MNAPFPPLYWNPNRVDLRVRGTYEESVAGGVIPPGSLIMASVAGTLNQFPPGTVVVHNVQGGGGEKAFALEHQLEGAIGSQVPVYAWDSYQVGTLVPYKIALPGDLILALGAYGFNYTEGMAVSSFGDGTLYPTPSPGGPAQQLYESTAESAAISNVNTITPFVPSPAYAGLPANSLQVGDVIHIRGAFTCPSTNSTDTLTLTLKIGSTVVIATAAVDVANNDIGLIDAYVTIRTIGASGTFVANGIWNLGTPGTATDRAFDLTSTAIDTTAVQTITMNATWSVASTSDQVTMTQLEVDLERTVGTSKIGIIQGGFNLVTTTTTTTAAPGQTVGQSQSPYNAIVIRVL